jgi:cytochrome P450
MSSSTAPGPTTREFFRFLVERRRDPLQALFALHKRHGELVHYATKRNAFFLVTSPADIRRILVENARNYSKDILYERMKHVMGRGLFTNNDADFWARQRKLVQPAYNREHLTSFAPLMLEHARGCAERWAERVATGEPIDVAAEMMRLTLDIVVETLLGSEAGAFRETVREGVATLIDGLEGRTTALRLLEMVPLASKSPALRKAVDQVPTATNRRFDAALAELDAIAYRLIEAKREAIAHGGGGRDILSLLIRARDDANTGMTDQQLRDEVMTALLAGHETSASALTWTFLELSRHPEADQRMLGEGDATAESLPQLAYGRRVFEEVLRLYPPLWRISRTCVADDTLGGYAVPAGAVMLLAPYFTHRLERVWDNPEGFEPDRFLPERFAKIERLAYLPFGGGARACMGREFAYQESLIILATILRRVRLTLVPGQTIALDPRLTLRSKFPLFMRARPAARGTA